MLACCFYIMLRLVTLTAKSDNRFGFCGRRLLWWYLSCGFQSFFLYEPVFCFYFTLLLFFVAQRSDSCCYRVLVCQRLFVSKLIRMGHTLTFLIELKDKQH